MMIIKGNGMNFVLEKDGRYTIGSRKCRNLLIKNPSISREHALIKLAEGVAMLRDLNSKYLTRYNGKELILDEEIKLGIKGQLSFGELTFDFEIKQTPEYILTGPDDLLFSVKGDGEYVIGRLKGNIILNYPSISRKHAIIEVRNGEAFLRDCDSKYLTQYNQRCLDVGEEVAIENSGQIMFGAVTFKVIVRSKMKVDDEPFKEDNSKRNGEQPEKQENNNSDIRNPFMSTKRKFIALKEIDEIIDLTRSDEEEETKVKLPDASEILNPEPSSGEVPIDISTPSTSSGIIHQNGSTLDVNPFSCLTKNRLIINEFDVECSSSDSDQEEKHESFKINDERTYNATSNKSVETVGEVIKTDEKKKRKVFPESVPINYKTIKYNVVEGQVFDCSSKKNNTQEKSRLNDKETNKHCGKFKNTVSVQVKDFPTREKKTQGVSLKSTGVSKKPENFKKFNKNPVPKSTVKITCSKTIICEPEKDESDTSEA